MRSNNAERTLRPLWVISDRAIQRQGRPMSAVTPTPIADKGGCNRIVRFVPCVDGSELARTFFTLAALVGAAMCSAC